MELTPTELPPLPTNAFPKNVKLALIPTPENPWPPSTVWTNAASVTSARAVLLDKSPIANVGAMLVNKNVLTTARLVDKSVSPALVLALLKALLSLK